MGITLIIIALLFGLIFVGVPIAFVLGTVGSISILAMPKPPLIIIAQNIFSSINFFALVAIPFFILAGELMNKSGITDRLVKFATMLIGRAPAGLAHANILASMFFGGITGAGTADTSAVGAMLIPAMEKEGYPKDFSVAVTAASSVIGPIIPPSIIMVIYGATVGVSIGAMFMAGMIPGILIGLALMGVVIIFDRIHHFPKRKDRVTLKEAVRTTTRAIWPMGMPIIIVGGILGGVFSPTEAGAIAVLYSLIVGFLVLRTLKIRDLIPMLSRTGLVTAAIMLVVGTAKILAWIFSVLRVQYAMVQFFLSISDSPILFLVLVNLLLLIMGTFLDGSASLIILAPVLAPVAEQLGINPIHFGIIMTMNLTIGLATPPLGLCLFIGCGIAELPLEKVVKPILPFVLAEVLVLLLVTYVPQISLLVPRFLGYV